MADKLLLDSNLMEAAAYGIFDAAPDAKTARDALISEYDKYNWTDPAKALQTLEDYGLAVKQKHADTSEFDKDFLFENAPVTLLESQKKVADKGEAGDINDVFTQWENDNLEVLKTTDNPLYAVAREQYMRDIPKIASASRREINAENRKEALGETGALLLDSVTRQVQGGVGLFNNPVEKLTGFSLTDYFTEVTDPAQDETFASALAGGVGSGLASTAGFIVGGPAIGTGLLIGQGAEPVEDRYKDTVYKTGSESIATKAATIEGVSQTAQIVGEKLIFGKAAKVATGKLLGKGPAEVAIAVAGESGAEGGGQFISNISENVSDQKPLLDDAGRGVGKSALVGGITAGGISTIANTSTPGLPTLMPKTTAKIIAEKDTGVRAEEIKQYGAPLTPVTKQVIGPVNPRSTGFEDIGVTSVEATPEALDAVLTATEEAPTTPSVEVEQVFEDSFITDDGSLYKTNQHGLTYKETVDGKTEDPFDFVKFANEETLEVITKALKEGKQIIPGPNGTPMIETIDGDKKHGNP